MAGIIPVKLTAEVTFICFVFADYMKKKTTWLVESNLRMNDSYELIIINGSVIKQLE